MEEAVKLRFDPRITWHDRQLPVWVPPQVERHDPRETQLAPSDPAQSTVLNSTARAIRELSDGSRSLLEIVEALRERYVADDAELFVDVTSALSTLRSLGLADWPADGPGERPPVKLVMGVEDKLYFHWQLSILFESLAGQLPEAWKIFVVVCNDHQPLSEPMLHILRTYGVRHFTATSHATRENIDFAGGGDVYVPFNRIEALRAVAPHVRRGDVVFLLDTDNFLYRELDPSVIPRENAVCENDIIAGEPFFTHSGRETGIDLQKLLECMGCTSRLGRGGVAVFLTGETVQNEKFVQDCFRFTQIVYLLAKTAGLPNRHAWISEMPCFALSLAANRIPHRVIDGKSFLVHKHSSIPSGTFYHYYGDLKDSSVDGAFYDSDWHKQRYHHVDLLKTDLEENSLAAVTDHERFFFELAKRAQRRLFASSAFPIGSSGEPR